MKPADQPTGQVVSVHFGGGFPSASLGKSIQSPHWEESLASQLHDANCGSRRPAVYPIGGQVQAVVVIEIAGTGTSGAPATLQGEFDGLTLMGNLTLADGRHSVSVTANLEDAISRHAGDVTWLIQADSLPAPLQLRNTTRLEVFTVLCRPEPFFANGVWGEALRLLVLQAGLTGVKDSQEAVRKITEYCHDRHGLSYDAHWARNYYGVEFSGGTFYLSAFLVAAHPLVSCFDLAAGVLVLSGAIGVPTNWLRLTPTAKFYILETNLIGAGPCNNPFFMRKNTPAVICRCHQDREPFAMHGFCESSQTIFDACIGPHLGRDARQAYLEAVADDVNAENRPVPNAASIRTVPSPIKQLV